MLSRSFILVFDHHSDMLKPLFGDILSCGSWILNAMEHNKYLKKVILIGIAKEQVALIDEKYQKDIDEINKVVMLTKIRVMMISHLLNAFS